MAFGRATCQLGALRAGRLSLGPVGRAGDRLAEQRADLPGHGAITDQPTPCAGLKTVLRRRPDPGWLVRSCDERRLKPVDRQLNVRIVEAGGPRRVERAAGVRRPSTDRVEHGHRLLRAAALSGGRGRHRLCASGLVSASTGGRPRSRLPAGTGARPSWIQPVAIQREVETIEGNAHPRRRGRKKATKSAANRRNRGGATVVRPMRPPDSNRRAVLSHFATLDRAPAGFVSLSGARIGLECPRSACATRRLASSGGPR